MTAVDPFVSPVWLAEHLADPGVKVLDGSWYLPSAERDPGREFREAHIPGAWFFDIDRVSDPNSDLPHMLPSADDFTAAMLAAGVGAEDTVVIYDSAGLLSAPRVWWMLRYFGHDDVRILEGGLPAWQSQGFETVVGDTSAKSISGEHFQACPRSTLLADGARVTATLADSSAQVLDARAEDRFLGRQPEPRVGLESGHMPGAHNLPFGELIDGERGTLKSSEELSRLFFEKGIPVDVATISSCGSGITACVIALALYCLGNTDVAVYDGSWVEWASSGQRPIEKG